MPRDKYYSRSGSGEWREIDYQRLCNQMSQLGLDVKTSLLALWNGKEVATRSWQYKCIIEEIKEDT
jgi:hypothetical protein